MYVYIYIYIHTHVPGPSKYPTKISCIPKIEGIWAIVLGTLEVQVHAQIWFEEFLLIRDPYKPATIANAPHVLKVWLTQAV